MSHDADTPLDQWEFDDPNEEIFFAIGWCDRPGVSGDFLGKIRNAHSRGADLSGPGEDGETPLTVAILDGMGAPKVVSLLLELGADPNHRAPSGWTPWAACCSRLEDPVVSDRMEEIRDALVSHGLDRSNANPPDDSAETRDELQGEGQVPPAGPPSPKFAELYEKHTDGINCGLTTDGLVAVLSEWDERLGIELSDVGHDRVAVSFASLPHDLAAFAREIYALCPDIVDQGFGCMGDMVEMVEETGRSLPENVRALIDGIDFADESFGLEILQRDLAARRAVALWWD
jgi:hypothetical protein